MMEGPRLLAPGEKPHEAGVEQSSVQPEAAKVKGGFDVADGEQFLPHV